MEDRKKEYRIDYFNWNQEEAKEERKDMENRIFEFLSEDDYKNLSELLDKYQGLKYLTNRFLQESETNEIGQISYTAGYVSALLNISERLFQKQERHKEFQNIKTLYKDKILLILYDRKTMFHKDLAEALGITPNNLTNIMKKMMGGKCNPINAVKNGKFVLYSLTKEGKNYTEKQVVKNQKKSVSEIKKSIDESSISSEYLPFQNLSVVINIADKPLIQSVNRISYVSPMFVAANINKRIEYDEVKEKLICVNDFDLVIN